MKITLSLNPDQSDAFAASLQHYYSSDDSLMAETFLTGCVDSLIEAAAKGKSVIAPPRLVRC
jgi:hypothetical protein